MFDELLERIEKEVGRINEANGHDLLAVKTQGGKLISVTHNPKRVILLPGLCLFDLRDAGSIAVTTRKPEVLLGAGGDILKFSVTLAWDMAAASWRLLLDNKECVELWQVIERALAPLVPKTPPA